MVWKFLIESCLVLTHRRWGEMTLPTSPTQPNAVQNFGGGIYMRGRIASVLAMLLCLASIATAQLAIDGVLTGRVEDTSGARIPGVTITVTAPGIIGERSTVTDEGGN